MAKDSRHREIAEVVAKLSQEHEINGLHVHVGIPDPESGLRALNTFGRWMSTAFHRYRRLSRPRQLARRYWRHTR